MFHSISRSQFVKNVATLVSGQAIAQALVVAASPILTLLYDPDAMGIFSLLVALSAPIVGIADLRYEMAVVSAKDYTEAANLLILSCGMVIAIFGLAAALCSLTGDGIAVLVDRPDLGTLMRP